MASGSQHTSGASSSADFIRLSHSHPPIDMAVDHIYFTFPSGRLTYDCVTCNAQCCRGHGYLLNRDLQADAHLRSRPNLHLFVGPDDEERNGTSVTIRNCPPGCFFLTQKGMCGIQLQHGYAAKPETCRLFPFNYFRRTRSHLIVSPHPTLCPLQVTPQERIDEKSRHDALFRDMQFQGITKEVPVCAERHGLPSEEVVALEQAIQAESARHETGSYVSFAATQLELTSLLLSRFSSAMDLGPSHVQLEVMEGFCTSAGRLLELSLSSDDLHDPLLTRTMIVATPFFRSLLVFGTGESDKSSPERVASLSRVPYVMMGIYVLAVAARTAGMATVTFQTLSRLAHSFDDLLLLLSDSNRVMVWTPGVSIPVSVSQEQDFETAYLRVAKALLAGQQRRRPVPLGDVLLEHCPFTGPARIRFLSMLARSLVTRIVPLTESAPFKVSLWGSVRSAIQRTALAVADEELASRFLTRQGSASVRDVPARNASH